MIEFNEKLEFKGSRMPHVGIEPTVVTLQVCCITNYASVAYGGGAGN